MSPSCISSPSVVRGLQFQLESGGTSHLQPGGSHCPSQVGMSSEVQETPGQGRHWVVERKRFGTGSSGQADFVDSLQGECAGVWGPRKDMGRGTLAGMESFRQVTQEVLAQPHIQPLRQGAWSALPCREGAAHQQRRGWGRGLREAGRRGTRAAAAAAGNRGWAPLAPARDSIPIPVPAERS